MSQESWRAICRREDCLPDTDTIQPPRTVLVDLTASEEEILARIQ